MIWYYSIIKFRHNFKNKEEQHCGTQTIHSPCYPAKYIGDYHCCLDSAGRISHRLASWSGGGNRYKAGTDAGCICPDSTYTRRGGRLLFFKIHLLLYLKMTWSNAHWCGCEMWDILIPPWLIKGKQRNQKYCLDERKGMQFNYRILLIVVYLWGWILL